MIGVTGFVNKYMHFSKYSNRYFKSIGSLSVIGVMNNVHKYMHLGEYREEKM